MTENPAAMAAFGTRYFLLWTTFLLLMIQSKAPCISASQQSDRKLYIVYMGDVPSREGGYSHAAVTSLYSNMLASVLGRREAAEESLRYSYGKSFGGFAAWLSPSHAQRLSNMKEVVSVFESKKLKLDTTKSWDFVGLPFPSQANNVELNYQSNVVVGVIDSGLWPESKSFSDEGLGPVPSKWRGACQTTSDFPACNKKIIGARYYHSLSTPEPGDFMSARDAQGHGTHTSSTAAGSIVKKASLHGIARGDARGGVPGARIAMYKVCWTYSGCSDADVLAAFDDAVYDGVDVISVSLSAGITLEYFEDGIAIGAFHAMKRGILTANSAGNDGPSAGSVSNNSPWSFTVAASTIDRRMTTDLLMGDGLVIEGLAINTFAMKNWYPLIHGRDAVNVSGGFSSEDASYCQPYSLDRKKVEGKIVFCYEYGDETVFYAGGVGAIIVSDDGNDTAFPSVLPATMISYAQGHFVESYINSTSSSVARIRKTDPTYDVPAPVVASFSSRGPSSITPDILKPDITAPGVDILAAWSKNATINNGEPEDRRRSNYNILSGTSMSCPHVAGAAAYVKSYHSDWSPAAIKSALMTTASTLDASLSGNSDAEFGYGAGQINPVKATDPGLVYDTGVNSYIAMLCSQGYNTTALQLVTGDLIECPARRSKRGLRNLNYPSIMAVSSKKKPVSASFLRTVTNVGPAKATYKAVVNAPSGMNVTLKPDTLSFQHTNQKRSYRVTVRGGDMLPGTFRSGAIIWSYGNYTVRSPIIVYSKIKKTKN